MSLLDEKTWMNSNFGLDNRLIKALSKLGYSHPTLVQAKCIPLALEGKDVLVRARTGSGKTVAFALPMLHKILRSKAEVVNSNNSSSTTVTTRKTRNSSNNHDNTTSSSSSSSSNSSSSSSSRGITAIILAPTNELTKQIEKNILDMVYYCKDVIDICGINQEDSSTLQFKLRRKPDILISTPAKLVKALQASMIDLSDVKTLIIDEADLVLSFGHAGDVQIITSAMPKIFQGLLMSATLSPELEKFKRVLLHNPVIVKLDESELTNSLLQFYVPCTENDKYLTFYVFLKLGLLQGRGLVFANDVNKCYRLKLFLKQFGINAAVLNSEIPFNSRLHALEEFNRGVFDLLIVTDAAVDAGLDDDREETEINNEIDQEEKTQNRKKDNENDDNYEEHEENDVEEEKKNENEEYQTSSKITKSKRSNSNKKNDGDTDYGLSRGIDFHGVCYVINFDLPSSAAGYTHRIGRCARGGASGTALSFVTSAQKGGNGVASAKKAELDQAAQDEIVLHEVRDIQPSLGIIEGDNVLGHTMGSNVVGGGGGANSDADESRKQPAPLDFDRTELEGFRYRVEDVLRSVTAVAVKELRVAEIKQEILNAARLQSHFVENPNDLKVLRHDKAQAHPVRQHDHLKHVPSYLIPAGMRSVVDVNNSKKRKRKGNTGGSRQQRISQGKSRDPLAVASGGADGDDDDNNTRQLSNKELYSSNSGREAWKMRHKKGKYNPKNKPNNRGLKGSLIKPKRHLG